MSPKPTGRLNLLGSRAELAFERHFKAPPEDVWQSITDPESLSRWIGTFTGEPGAGKTVQFRMLFEQGDATSAMHIEVCEPPRRLVVSTNDEQGSWHIELRLQRTGDTTTLTFVQHLDDAKIVGDVGPGWEYYLDMLVAARAGAPKPSFDDYYPSQRDYFLRQLPE